MNCLSPNRRVLSIIGLTLLATLSPLRAQTGEPEEMRRLDEQRTALTQKLEGLEAGLRACELRARDRQLLMLEDQLVQLKTDRLALALDLQELKVRSDAVTAGAMGTEVTTPLLKEVDRIAGLIKAMHGELEKAVILDADRRLQHQSQILAMELQLLQLRVELQQSRGADPDGQEALKRLSTDMVAKQTRLANLEKVIVEHEGQIRLQRMAAQELAEQAADLEKQIDATKRRLTGIRR